MDNILIMDKPKDMTSNRLVQIVKRTIKARKVGHAGTLDPNATGVMVLGINKGTKLLGGLTSQEKRYTATIEFGIHTDTYDVEGEVTKRKEVMFSKYELEKVINSFKGEYMQTPPIFSAIKIKGKKLYDYARQDKEVELPKRLVNIKEINLLDYKNGIAEVDVLVSKGTYIRSLAVDIAAKLDNYAILKDLRRTQSGEFTINDSITLEELKEKSEEYIQRYNEHNIA